MKRLEPLDWLTLIWAACTIIFFVLLAMNTVVGLAFGMFWVTGFFVFAIGLKVTKP